MTAVCPYCGEETSITRADSRRLDGGLRVAAHIARCPFWPRKQKPDFDGGPNA